ncbi:chaplin [Streptomyces sp. NPDC047002]|uniref:chaplin n=1 Tax=Streptomyces sp. NPDC047002 TaxID=3155475 RepID=UPI003451AE84
MRDLISKGLLTAAAATSVLSLGGGHAFASDAQGAATGSPGVLSGNNVQVPVEIPVNLCGNTVDAAGVGNPAFGNKCANVTQRHTHRQYEQAYQDAMARTHGQQAPADDRSAAPAADRSAAPAPAAGGAHSAEAPTTLPAPVHQPAPRPGDGSAGLVPSPATPMGTPQQPAPAHGTTPTRSAAPAPVAAAQHRGPDGGHGDHQGYGGGHQQHGGPSAQAGSGSHAAAVAQGSPGVLSGNLAQLPIDIPVNACGNTIDIVGLLNPAFGNHCETGSTPAPPQHHPHQPPAPQPPHHHHHTPPPPPVRHTPPPPVHTSYVPPAPATPQTPQLAHTGADSDLLGAGALSAGLLLGGTVLYRRGTAAARARR